MNATLASPSPVLHRWALTAFFLGCLAFAGLFASSAANAAEVAVSQAGPFPFGIAVALMSALAAVGGFFGWRRTHGDPDPEPTPTPSTLGAARHSKAPVRPAAVPQLEALEWDGGLPVAPKPVQAIAAPPLAVAPTPTGLVKPPEAHRQKILERYLAARFAGVASRLEDLMDSTAIVKSARLLFEDGQSERAIELLAIAAQAHPADEATYLARLEILFLERDGVGYRRVAKEFAERHPASQQWPEIRELARGMGLDDAMFRDQGVRENSFPQYGPWPGMPNWIQAPWDLTAEVTAAELHSRLRTRAEQQRNEAIRRTA